MEDLSKWTSGEFKSAENDLLEKRKRRQEIPEEIKNREQRIQLLQQQITEYQNELSKLQKEELRLESRKHHLEDSFQNTFVHADDPQYAKALAEQREQLQRQISSIEEQLDINRKEQSRCTAGIHSNRETIRVLELEIENRKAEDQKITEECREYIRTFQDVASSAEKSAQSHGNAGTKFAQAAQATRFGQTQAQAGKQVSDSMVKKYKDIQKTALMLMRLAIAIVDGAGNTDSGYGGASAENGSSTGTYGQNVMEMGYAGTAASASGQGSAFPTNPDGTADFSAVSFAGEVSVDPHHISAQELDDWVGKKQFGLSAEQIRTFRKDSGVVWQIEGGKAYLVHKEYAKHGSMMGYALGDWEDTSSDIKKRTRK